MKAILTASDGKNTISFDVVTNFENSSIKRVIKTNLDQIRKTFKFWGPVKLSIIPADRTQSNYRAIGTIFLDCFAGRDQLEIRITNRP